MIVATYAGLLALIFIALSVNVIIRRYQLRSALGDADDFEMKRRIRAHANFAEYTPLFLILISLAEYEKLSNFYLHILCTLFLLGRISHALSVLKLEKYENGKLLAYPYFRAIGMLTSFLAIGITALLLIL